MSRTFLSPYRAILGATIFSLGLCGCGSSQSPAAFVQNIDSLSSFHGMARSSEPLAQRTVIVKSPTGQVLHQVVTTGSGLFALPPQIRPPFEIEVDSAQGIYSAFVEKETQALYGVNIPTTLSNRLRKLTGISGEEADRRVRLGLGLPEGADLLTLPHRNPGLFSHAVFLERAQQEGGFEPMVNRLVSSLSTPISPQTAAGAAASFAEDANSTSLAGSIGGFLGNRLANKLTDLAIGWALSQVGIQSPEAAGIAQMLQELKVIEDELSDLANSVAQIQQELQNSEIANLLLNLNQSIAVLNQLHQEYKNTVNQVEGSLIFQSELDSLVTRIHSQVASMPNQIQNVLMGLNGNPGLVALLKNKFVSDWITRDGEQRLLDQIGYLQGYQVLATNLLTEAAHVSSPMPLRELEQTLDQLQTNLKAPLQQLPFRTDRHMVGADGQLIPLGLPILSDELIYDVKNTKFWTRESHTVLAGDVRALLTQLGTSLNQAGPNDFHYGNWRLPRVSDLEQLRRVGGFSKLAGAGFKMTRDGQGRLPTWIWCADTTNRVRFPPLYSSPVIPDPDDTYGLNPTQYLQLYDLDSGKVLAIPDWAFTTTPQQLLLVRFDTPSKLNDFTAYANAFFYGLYEPSTVPASADFQVSQANAPNFGSLKDYTSQVNWSLAINGDFDPSNNIRAYISNLPGSEGKIRIRDITPTDTVQVRAIFGPWSSTTTFQLNPWQTGNNNTIAQILVSPIRYTTRTYSNPVLLSAQAVTVSGQILDVTSQVDWNSSNPLVTITPGGSATLTSPTSAQPVQVTVEASMAGVTGTSTFVLVRE